MLSTWRPAGVSFGLRLFTLLLVPLVGLGVLAVQRIDDERTSAAIATALVQDARLQQDIAAVYGPAQLEQVALEGLTAIDALGVPRDLVVTIAGVDFEKTYDDNRVAFDSALDVLKERHGDVMLGDFTFGRRLGAIRGRLAIQRGFSTEHRAEQEDIREVFAELDILLADLLGSTQLQEADSDRAMPTTDRVTLAALNQVLVSAGDRGQALLDGLLEGSAEATSGIESASTRLDFAIEQFRALLDDAHLDALEAVTEDLRPVPPLLLTPTTNTSIATDFDPAYISESSKAVVNQLSFLAALGAFSNDFHTEFVAGLEEQAITADEAAFRTQLLVAVTAVVSLLILFLLSWSTLRPLRRLTKRAHTIGGGAFDASPLPVRGPSDVRTLTSTMNSMAATLSAVDGEISDLASGARVEHDHDLPGAIGVSLQQSFQRLEDMTARLHESEQLSSAIVAQAADAIWTVDVNGLITSANHASVDLLSLEAADQIGRPIAGFLERTDGEVDVTSTTGESARVLVASSPIEGATKPLTTVIAHDISERLRFEERLAYQAHHDALTGLPNRFAVLDRLADADPRTPVAVLFVDLDGFKSVNDTQGHLAGDRVLTEVGRRLSTHVRPGDFVGRLGGDEFVVVMHHLDKDADAVAFGYRLIAEVEQPYQDDEHLFTLSASVGIATYPEGLEQQDHNPLDAIRCADSAVYAAKRRGRGRVEVFDAQLQARIVQDAEIEFALRNAVRNDELELHLQPVFDVSAGRFNASEALVRWNRPGIGVVPPGDFIPVAEKSSLIDEISRWVLTEACCTLARWDGDDALHDQKIAVNIAGSHLLDGHLLADLDAALLLSGADPTRLEFELTETQIVDDHERASAVLREVRRRGITVAIDDFGTGYSSMAYLRELPIDTLKIDSSFVSPLSSPDADTTVVDALITIGHALGLSVVGEGVEDSAQLDHLVDRGCDRIQGFLLERPMQIGDAEEVLRQSAAAHEVGRHPVETTSR